MTTTTGFGMRFFGRNPFDKDARKQFQKRWSKMTDNEKLDFANERFGNIGEDRFSIEKLDTLCEEWTKMTVEEKQAFIDERKNTLQSRIDTMHGFWGREHQ